MPYEDRELSTESHLALLLQWKSVVIEKPEQVNKSTCLRTTLKLQRTGAPTSYISILAVTPRRTKPHARARRWGDVLDTGRRQFHTVNDAANVVNGMRSHPISTSVKYTDRTTQSPLRGLSHGHTMWLITFLSSSQNASIAARTLMLKLVRT